MVGRSSRQRLVDLSLQVLGCADTPEVRLALAVSCTILRERSALMAFWDRLLRENAKPWESAHAELCQVKHALQREDWVAPPAP